MTRRRLLFATLLVLAHVGLLVALMRRVESTTDELNYILAGRALVEDGSWDTVQERLHGPLAFVANQTWISRLDVQTSRNILLRARLGMLPFAVLLLVVIGAWAWEAWGWRGGLLALFLAAFDPMLLGYGTLVAVDMSLAATATCTLWLLWRWLQRPTAVRLLAWSGSLGLCLATKYLALLLAASVPWIVLAAVLLGADVRPRRLCHTRPAALQRLAWGALALGGAALVSLLFLHAAYLFQAPSYDPARDGETSSVVLSALRGTPLLSWFLELLPAPLVLGVDFQITATQELSGVFMDRLGPNWQYYLVSLGTKLRVPILLLGVLGLAGWRRAAKGAAGLILCSVLPGVLLLAYLSFFNTFQQGIRYALPIVPLCLVWAGGAASAPWWHDRRMRFVAGAGGAWLLVATAVSWPHYLGYFNELIGGPGGAFRLFSDANCDWSQNIEEGRRAVEERHENLQVLEATDGPRFGTVGIYVWAFASRDPERPGRTYHWLRRFDPVDHHSAAWYVFTIGPADFAAAARAGDPRAARDLALAWVREGDLARAEEALTLADEGERTDAVRELIDLLGILEAGKATGAQVSSILNLLWQVKCHDLARRIVELHLKDEDLDEQTWILFINAQFEPAIDLLRAADREKRLTPQLALRLATMLYMIDPGSLEALQVLRDHPAPESGDPLEARYWKVRRVIENDAENRRKLIESVK
ncbi:MAG: hypothetical protein AB1726_12710 [Planctomycetota bacterium]